MCLGMDLFLCISVDIHFTLGCFYISSEHSQSFSSNTIPVSCLFSPVGFHIDLC